MNKEEITELSKRAVKVSNKIIPLILEPITKALSSMYWDLGLTFPYTLVMCEITDTYIGFFCKCRGGGYACRLLCPLSEVRRGHLEIIAAIADNNKHFKPVWVQDKKNAEKAEEKEWGEYLRLSAKYDYKKRGELSNE